MKTKVLKPAKKPSPAVYLGMNIQEQEHWEHVAGSFRSEHEAAYSLSRRETHIQCQDAEINSLTAAGKFVVVESHEVCCRHTDAILGVTNTIVSIHDTEAEAIAAAGNVEEYGIARPQGFDAHGNTSASPDFTNATDNDFPF